MVQLTSGLPDVGQVPECGLSAGHGQREQPNPWRTQVRLLGYEVLSLGYGWPADANCNNRSVFAIPWAGVWRCRFESDCSTTGHDMSFLRRWLGKYGWGNDV